METLLQYDARPVLSAGQCPFDPILETAQRVAAGGTFRLIAPFEPEPLYAVLAARGFTRVDTRREGEAVVVDFRAGGEVAAPPAELFLDLRGLEPPQPMMRLLEEFAGLPEGAALRALTRFRPIHLLAALGEHQAQVETVEVEGGWEVRLRKPFRRAGCGCS